jgi:hypothetical protein
MHITYFKSHIIGINYLPNAEHINIALITKFIHIDDIRVLPISTPLKF